MTENKTTDGDHRAGGDAGQQPDTLAGRRESPRDRVVPTFRFEELSQGSSVVHIELQGTKYVLRRTRLGGLILNK